MKPGSLPVALVLVLASWGLADAKRLNPFTAVERVKRLREDLDRPQAVGGVGFWGTNLHATKPVRDFLAGTQGPLVRLPWGRRSIMLRRGAEVHESRTPDRGSHLRVVDAAGNGEVEITRDAAGRIARV